MTGIPGWARCGGTPAMLREPDPESARQVLRDRFEALGSELDQIRKRLDELETGPGK